MVLGLSSANTENMESDSGTNPDVATNISSTQGLRMVWKFEQETALVTLFEELAAENKFEGGNFKAGSVKTVVKKMSALFPTNNYAVKHIVNKNKRLKEKYGVISDMLRCSGFEWNGEKKCVEVNSRQVLEEYLKRNPSATNVVGKPFPLYERLQLVYGKDQANGEFSQNPSEVLEEINRPGYNTPTAPTTPNTPFVDTEIDIEDFRPLSPNPSTHPSAYITPDPPETSSRKLKPRKGNFKMFVEVVKGGRHDFVKCAKELKSMPPPPPPAEHVQVGCVESKGVVAYELRKTTLSNLEQIRACIILKRNPELAELFWELLEEQREAYARELLLNHYK